MVTRRQIAARHVRDRVKLVAGVTASITRGSTVLAASCSVTRVGLDKVVTAEQQAFIEATDAAWLLAVSDYSDELIIGDMITIDGVKYRVCEGTGQSQHWQWWDLEQTSRVYSTKVWR